MTTPIKVSVIIITYNHEPYIEKAINSVLKQCVDFIYEIIIGEDFSTDNTRNICQSYEQKYLSKIKLIQRRKNVGAQLNFVEALELAEGKYTAILEGDDYWTDDYKLQKQVDFLEANAEYGMVHTNYMELSDRNNRITKINYSNPVPSGEIYEEVLTRPFICTLTMLIRTKLIKEFIEQFREQITNWVVGDLPLKIFISKHFKIKYLDDVTGVYRIRAGSMVHENDREKKIRYFQGLNDIENFFIREYGCTTACQKKLHYVQNKRNFYISYLLDDDIEIERFFRRLEKRTLKDYMVYFYTINKHLRKPLDKLRTLWIAHYRKW